MNIKRALLCAAILSFSLQLYVLAASADVSLGSGGREFECDTTQRTATVNVRGGSILNKSTDSVWVDFDAGTVSTSNGGTSIELAQNTSVKIPQACGSFTFKTASGTSYIIYVGP